MYNELIVLIKEKVINVGGTATKQTIRTSVFARAKSIGYREFYSASAVGLKPEITFIIADRCDYEGQKLCEYDGEKYDIIRTFFVGEGIELTCQRRIT